MKKLLIGAAVGLTAAGVIYRLYKRGSLDCMCENLDAFTNKAKRNIKNAVDMGKNQAEYIKDRVEYEFQNGKEKLMGDTEK